MQDRLFKDAAGAGARLAAILLTFAMSVGEAKAVTTLPDFSAASFVPGAAIDNPYFPLGPTFRTNLVAEGVDEDGETFEEESQLSFAGPGRAILGVATTVQRDLAYEGGLLVEKTADYYAQDTAGNVWYMGEDVVNYRYDDDGNLIGTDNASAWIAGENGALPGWIMPAGPVVGLSYFQEFALADAALDEARIFATGLVLDVDGVSFSDVLAILETTQLDPDARELKYYAPGVGVIRADEGLDLAYANPELVFERVSAPAVPLPASLPLLLVGIGALAGLRKGRSARA